MSEDIMEERKKLHSFINKEYTDDCKKKILNAFPGYVIDECYNYKKFCCEYYIENGIRIYIKNNVINEIQFG